MAAMAAAMVTAKAMVAWAFRLAGDSLFGRGRLQFKYVKVMR
jgi:hypothetical protein